MNPKLIKLIKLLVETETWMTATQISNNLSISVRTVKNYINEINTFSHDCIVSSNNGYLIERQKAQKLLNEFDDNVYQGANERINFLISRIIRSKDPLNIFDISDELFVSSSTIKSDFSKLKTKLSKFDLNLVNSQDFLTITGLEKNKRKILSSLLYEESNESIIVLESIQKAFPNVDVQFVKQCINDIFNESKIYVNDFAMITLIMHIAIAIHRIQNHAENLNISTSIDNQLKEINEVAHKLVQQIENKYQIKFSIGEVDNLTILIYSSTTVLDYKNISSDNLEEIIGKETVKLVKNLVKDLGAYYMIDFNDRDFLTRFSLHIKNLLIRSQNNQYSKNPMTETIRKSCPLLYDTSVVMASKLNELTGAIINEDEIAYIAFHLGGAIETQKSSEEKIRCVLFCPTYYDTSTKLKDSITRHFNEQLNLVTIMTDENELKDLNTIDLVLTTIPLNQPNISPFVQNISLFLNQKDIESIFQKINQIKKEKKKIQFLQHLQKMFNPDLFMRNIEFKSEYEAIDFMVDKLIKSNYVGDNFKKEILERESMSSTSFNNLAIPHSMKMNAKKTGLFVIINDKPTPWGQNKVNLIMMLTINKFDRSLFNEVYENLTMILTEPDAMNGVLHAQNYNQFIETLVNYL